MQLMTTSQSANGAVASDYILKVAAGTHPGIARDLNEDAVFSLVRPEGQGENAGLLIVADGMGGHQAGEVASKLAVETVRNSLSWLIDASEALYSSSHRNYVQTIVPSTELDKDPSETYPETSFVEHHMRSAIRSANQMIYAYAQKHSKEAGNLGTTITCAIVLGTWAVVGNVGDSRLYHYRDGKLRLITSDHSYVSHLVRLGRIAPEEVFDHPQRNLITRSLGRHASVDIDTWTIELEVGDRLLLCSDGLWEMVRDSADIARILTEKDHTHAMKKLILEANLQGGQDNVSVVVAELGAKPTR